MNARELALKIINDINVKQAYANVTLNKFLSRNTISEQDRRFITELVYGTIKVGATIDWILSKYINRPLHKISPIIQDILRMGLYQILFMDKVPNSAACNQSVDLTKKYGHSGTVKFVNGVLRNVIRYPEKSKYPDKSEDVVQYLALKYYHPQWLIENWISRLGEESTEKLCEYNNQVAELSIRTNTLKITRDELLKRLLVEGAIAIPSQLTPEGILCKQHSTLTNMPSLIEGLFQVQDESSMLVAHVLDPKPGEFIIDTCSAPGGKTTHIAALMKNSGKILAADIYEHKLNKINENVRRLGISIIHTELINALDIGDKYPMQADRVLVDAPCSGLGVLRKKPDSRWRKSKALIKELAELQIKILTSAAKAVKPGGVLVYSTCTTEIEENDRIIEKFLEANPEFALDDAGKGLGLSQDFGKMIQLWPHIHNVDGFFIARMHKSK